MRPIEDLEPHYSRHVAAMTREKLHAKSDIAAELACRDWEIERLTAEGERKDAVIEAAKAYKQAYELCEGGISIECEAALQEALNAVSGKQCEHPVHKNPGLIAPCPECGADDSADSRQTREENLESALRTILCTKSTIPRWIRELARTALNIASAHRNRDDSRQKEDGHE